jgi:hypothetical protein
MNLYGLQLMECIGGRLVAIESDSFLLKHIESDSLISIQNMQNEFRTDRLASAIFQELKLMVMVINLVTVAFKYCPQEANMVENELAKRATSTSLWLNSPKLHLDRPRR